MNAPDATSAFEHAEMDELRPCMEGMVPSIMATVAPDGTPNVAYIVGPEIFVFSQRSVVVPAL